MDRKSKQLIIIGVCIILAVVGCLYQIKSSKNKPSLKSVIEVLADE